MKKWIISKMAQVVLSHADWCRTQESDGFLGKIQVNEMALFGDRYVYSAKLKEDGKQ